MASLYDLKPAFQGLLRPLSNRLAAAGVSANQVTLAALVLSLAGGALVTLWPRQSWPLLVIPLVLFLRMALNAIDGMLAREHDMKSSLGALLNELGDVFSDALLYLPLALVPEIPALPVILAVLLGVMVEMSGVVAVQIGASRRYDGPMGKSDRALVFGSLALAAGLGLPLSPWVGWLLAAVLLLSLVTLFNRARRALEEVA
jgi:CDP-diacylglycerol--glycerol-3-phosphate 3-phosphatidyltransferase